VFPGTFARNACNSESAVNQTQPYRVPIYCEEEKKKQKTKNKQENVVDETVKPPMIPVQQEDSWP